MAQLITDKLIRETDPNPGKLVWLYDNRVPGFSLRISSGGAKTYYLIYIYQRKQDRIKISRFEAPMKTEQARKEALRLWKMIRTGQNPKHDTSAPTLKALATRYLESQSFLALRDETKAGYIHKINKLILPRLGNVLVKDIRRSHAEDLAAHVTEDRGPSQANRTDAVLTGLLSYAVERDLLAFNPLVGTKKKWRHKETGRKRYLSEAEVERLFDCLDTELDGPSADIIPLLLLTGARKGEVLAMTWDQVDIATGVWTKPAALTKQGDDHMVPLSDGALAIVRRRHQAAGEPAGGDLVFPGILNPKNQYTALTKRWYEIRVRCGLEDVHLHDLRHSFASLMVNKGLGLPVIGALLGHKKTQTTARYAHLNLDALREATNLVGKAIAPSNVEQLRTT